MAVYRSQYRSDDDDGEDEPRSGRHAVPEEPEPSVPSDHGSLDYTSLADPGTPASGTVYGRPRHSAEPEGESYDEPEPPQPEPPQASYQEEIDWDSELGFDRRGSRTREDLEGYDERPPPRRSGMDGVRAGVRGFGELLITFGLVVLLFAGYEVWGKAAQVDAAQNDLDHGLTNDWGRHGSNSSTDKPIPGDAIARLYIPKLKLHWVIVQGVTPADLKKAPGHYPDSALPGKVGNFSVAGHRMPRVFWDLDRMRQGDAIYAEDRKHWYRYEVTEIKIVSPQAVEVVAPVPGQPGAKPRDAMLTLTTCNPKWDNYERLIVHAKLIQTLDKSEGRPIGLDG